MLRSTRGFLPAVLLVVLVNIASGAPPEMQPPAPPEPWEKLAGEQNLTKEERKLLREQRFVVTGLSLRQVFDPYTGGSVAVFITSDSVLNAYHVLLEESIYRMELAHSRKLPGVLEQFTKHLDATAAKLIGDDVLPKGAKKRAAIFLGVARNLLDEKALPDAADVKAEVQEEVKRILAASGASKPAWLGPPDDGFLAIDYSRFKPRGFYTRTPALQRYFRAVSWLQAIPFRADRDEELAAFLLMRTVYLNREQEVGADASIWRAFRAFLGDQDDWDLSTWWLPREVTKHAMEKIKTDATVKYDRSQLNDQLRFAPTEPGAKAEFAFRFLSAYRLPDAVMFHRTMQPKELKRDFPTGLEVAAALGSPFARDTIKKDNPQLLAGIDATRPLFQAKNLYAEYLKCLGVLVERVEPDAPEFMRGEPWRIKTAQTALAGWAQMRHTWALQAKINIDWLSSTRQQSGFVEPVPEFYGLLAALIDDTNWTLKRSDAFGDFSKEVLEALEEDARTAKAIVNKAIEKKVELGSFTAEERSLLARFDPRLEYYWDKPEKERKSAEALQDLLRMIDHAVHEVKWNAEHFPSRKVSTIEPNWGSLSALCRKLEVLAHKQLRQVPFNDAENKFILDYGRNLGGIMFYGGNSYQTPLDDAMRVVDVYSNPSAGGHLHVGIARPRVMWVLYPTKNGEVPCRGAIVPYAELVHGGRLTDGEWKGLLDSPKRPDVPAWARPVIPPERPRGR